MRIAMSKMSVAKLLMAGLAVGVVSVIYNFLIFWFTGIYADVTANVSLGLAQPYDFFVISFLKNVLVGMIMMVLFGLGYRFLKRGEERDSDLVQGVFFLILYGVFAFISFSVGDFLLMQNQQGLLLLVTVDGVIETLIATLAIRFVSFQ